jgi:hypothetical protein
MTTNYLGNSLLFIFFTVFPTPMSWWPSWFGYESGGSSSVSPEPEQPSLDFSSADNSGYLAAIGGF